MANSQDYLRDLRSLGYSFRYNEVTDRIEVNGQPITDAMAAKIRTQMRDLNNKRMSEVEDAYTAHAFDNCYHPVRDYIRGLQWDGGAHIDKLAGHFTDTHGMFPIYLRRWLIGAVAKAFERTQNFMLVLDGMQGGGKSYFANWLCPAAMIQYSVEGAINATDKDAWRRLTTKWLWEVGEFGATVRKADREVLKDFVTRLDVTIRLPYGKYDTVRPALASLIGTVNNEGAGILNDPSGSRRFAVVTLESIDWAYAALDVNQVWAEAYFAYQGGESWELTAAERARQAAINEEYELESGVEGFLRKYYDLDPNGSDWTAGVDIVQELEVYGLKGVQVVMLRELASLMKRAGHERKRIKQVWSYRGVTRKNTGVII